ncbi:MAG: tetratricopeptide repeat protein [Nannocystaceae bacterium]|nr:tetratricopeptide repeat protein [Nannocystaceae bacterium]
MECPEENVVVDFVRGEVDEPLRVAIERHLDGCPACMQVVAELARIFQLPVEPDAGTFGNGQTLVETSPMSKGSGVDDAFVASLSEGSKLGRYVVLSRVGAGGMGVVFAAYDPELDRKVAIKLLRGAPGGSGPKELADQRARLLREAQAMARLSHANVITVHDVGTIDGQVFVAMEFIDGSTLSAWLRERRHGWREVMTVLLAAGRGLAAAHAAGLVHRDFKPDNVLLGKDGRVLVTDFGLARPAAGKTDAFAAVGTTSSSRVLGLALTQTGALVGTPAYMAPEQLAGERSDALTDQFSYCVALYEGLFGERPFAGRVLAELIANVSEGNVRPIAARSPVPRWVRRALLRGLAVRPEDRYPSMEALLQALVRDPWRRWRQAALIGVPAAAVGVATLVYEREQPRVAPYCQDVREKLAGVWDDDQRERIRQRFVATGKAWADDGLDAVARKLDPYVEHWLALQTQACRDEVEGARPQAVLALQMTCLERRRDALRALTELLAGADEATLEHAVDAADRLPELDVCADLERLMAREGSVDATVDPEVRRELDLELARARVLGDAARLTDSREIATKLAARAKAAGYGRGEAVARELVAVSQDLQGDLVAAERGYHEALSAALASGDAEVVVRASIGLIWIGTDPTRPIVEADRWYAHGKGALERMGGDVELGAELERVLGIAYLQHGDLGRAEQHVRASVEIRRAAVGEDHESLGAAYGTLGELLAMQGRTADAVAALQHALALVEREYGPMHPSAAASHDNLGSALAEAGQNEAALVHMRAGLTIREAAMGPDHPLNATSLHNIAGALRELGRAAEAREAAVRQREIARKHFGERHPEYATAIANLAMCDDALGNIEAARAGFAQALEIIDAAVGHDTLPAAQYSGSLAAVLVELDRAAEALPLAEHSLAVRRRLLGEDHPKVGLAEALMSNVLRMLDRGDEAVAHGELAVATLGRSDGDREPLAEARFALARALLSSKAKPPDRVRARSEAEAALAILRPLTSVDAGEIEEIEAWLAANP